jgi:AraC family transcriptional regulator
MRTVTLRDYKRRLLRVLVYVQQHLDDELKLEELARLASFSPYHFHRIFKGMVGESVKAYVRRLRLERAASRLKLGAAPVTDIALEAGYESHEAFTRIFHSVFRVAPSRFRASKRAQPPVPVPSGLHYPNGQRPASFKTAPAGATDMKVKIEHREPLRVAFMRHVGPYSKVGETWDRFLPRMGKEGWLGGDALFIGICHDDPEVTPPNKIRYDACVTVDERFVAEGEIGVQVVPGGDYAVTTHIGPHNRLGDTYSRLLGRWLPRSGRELRSSPCFDVYLNGPESTSPRDLLTDVYAPLLPAAAARRNRTIRFPS